MLVQTGPDEPISSLPSIPHFAFDIAADNDPVQMPLRPVSPVWMALFAARLQLTMSILECGFWARNTGIFQNGG
jgi:hypothetical protein